MKQTKSALHKIVAEVVRSAPEQEAPLLAWPAICGTKIAARTRVLGLSRGVLRVQVPDRTWRSQLNDLKNEYLAAFNAVLKKPVKEIQFLLPGENPDVTAGKKKS